MLTQLLTIGLLMLFSAMLPGPDFAIVTKNTLLGARRAGFFTTFGIVGACLVHITYCLLGVAIIISQSIWLFNLIKYLGAAYLVYLGIVSLFTKQLDSAPTRGTTAVLDPALSRRTRARLSDARAFWQGFLCNLMNPKATLFFLALFTVIIKPETSNVWKIIIAIEMLIIITTWFCSLTILLSHPRVLGLLTRMEQYIAKMLGIFLIGFGVALAFVKR